MKDVVTGAPRRRRVLVTGFGPFPGAPVNPTVEMLARLKEDELEGVTFALLPVTFGGVMPALRQAVAVDRPDAILHLGLASRRMKISIETRARNRVGLAHRDAAGHLPDAAHIDPAAPATIAATWPAMRILAALREAGLPARLSDDAGDYVCNATLYRSLLEALAPCIGFLHVPRPRDTARGVRPTLEGLVTAARLAVTVLSDASGRNMPQSRETMATGCVPASDRPDRLASATVRSG